MAIIKVGGQRRLSCVDSCLPHGAHHLPNYGPAPEPSTSKAIAPRRNSDANRKRRKSLSINRNETTKTAKSKIKDKHPQSERQEGTSPDISRSVNNFTENFHTESDPAPTVTYEAQFEFNPGDVNVPHYLRTLHREIMQRPMAKECLAQGRSAHRQEGANLEEDRDESVEIQMKIKF